MDSTAPNRPIREISQLVAVLGCILATVFWGGMYVVSKDALNLITPNYLLGIRFFLAFILFAVIFHKSFGELKTNPEAIKGCVVTGAFMAVGYASLTVGLQYINAGSAAFITDSYVVWIPIVLWLFWKKKPDGPHIFLSGVLCLLGIALLTLQGGLHISFGDSITLFGAFMWTGELIAIDIYSKKVSPDLLVTGQTLVVAVICFLLAPITGEALPTMDVLLDPKMIAEFAYLIILATVVANFLQNYCMRFTTSTQVSVIFPCESIFAAVFGVVFLAEKVNLMSIAGMALVFAAILMSNLGDRFFKKKDILEA